MDRPNGEIIFDPEFNPIYPLRGSMGLLTVVVAPRPSVKECYSRAAW